MLVIFFKAIVGFHPVYGRLFDELRNMPSTMQIKPTALGHGPTHCRRLSAPFSSYSARQPTQIRKGMTESDWLQNAPLCEVPGSGVTIISGPLGKYSLRAPSKFDSQIW